MVDGWLVVGGRWSVVGGRWWGGHRQRVCYDAFESLHFLGMGMGVSVCVRVCVCVCVRACVRVTPFSISIPRLARRCSSHTFVCMCVVKE